MAVAWRTGFRLRAARPCAAALGSRPQVQPCAAALAWRTGPQTSRLKKELQVLKWGSELTPVIKVELEATFSQTKTKLKLEWYFISRQACFVFGSRPRRAQSHFCGKKCLWAGPSTSTSSSRELLFLGKLNEVWTLSQLRWRLLRHYVQSQLRWRLLLLITSIKESQDSFSLFWRLRDRRSRSL